MSRITHPDNDSPTLPAELALFGFDSTPAEVRVVARSRRWRLFRAGRLLLATILVAPVVALVPPHAPWLIGAVVGGLFLARRQWQHRYSIQHLRGTCPRCGKPVAIARTTRLADRHALPCESCHHEPVLRVDPGLLPTADAATTR